MDYLKFFIAISLVLWGAGSAYGQPLSECPISTIKQMYAQGHQKEAMDAARTLLKNATKAGDLELRIAALEILFYQPSTRLKTLNTALKDKEKRFRSAALNFASTDADKSLYTELFKMLPKAKTDVKVDILLWIGNEAACPEKKAVLKTIETGIEKTGTQTLIELLNDPDLEVKQAAIRALGAIGDKQALPAIAGLLKSDDARLLSSVYETIDAYPEDVCYALARAVSLSSDEGKKIILELLSRRKANTYFTLVLEQTKSSNPEVRNKAYETLKDVVSEKDFVVLCGMLEISDPAYVEYLQQAIVSVLSQLSPEKRLEAIENRILQAGDAKRYLYEPVLDFYKSPEKMIK